MKIYLVGGAVRDSLLFNNINNKINKTDKDWVVTQSSPEEMLRLGFMPVGKDFPVFLHPQTHEEYALARTERKIRQGYTGFELQTSPEVTLEEDLQRRDLTINAIAMTPEGEIIDPYHGQKDLAEKILRHVSHAFAEDPVRILRIARFMARFSCLGFSIAPETLALMRSMVKSGEIDALVADRVWQETQKSLGEKSPEKFFEVLSQCGALDKLFPEIKINIIIKINFINNIINNNIINFGRLSLSLNSEQIKNLCARYPVPAAYKNLALSANLIKDYFIHHDNISSRLSSEDIAAIFNILEKTDAFRRKKRFFLLLKIFQHKKNNFLIKNLKKSLSLVQKINIKNLIQQGWSGKILGEKIRQKRLELLLEKLPGSNKIIRN